jgi:hypothetical protein
VTINRLIARVLTWPLIADAPMRVRGTRAGPWPFPWIQAFPGANCRQHSRTGSTHPHGRIRLGWRS